MRFVIVGAGAIGAYIGALMAQSGEHVTLFARGAHFKAMRRDGVRVIQDGKEFVVRPEVSNSLEEIGLTDVVILGVKAHSLPGLAPRLKPLLGPDTVVVSTQNGIPWWYFQRYQGDLEGLNLEPVDPGGKVADAILPSRVLGSIIYFSTEIAEPGIIRHTEGNRMSLGEPDGTRSVRCKSLAELLNKSGLKCRVTTRIRHEIWVKLMGNVAFNPMSALTRATIGEMLGNSEVRDLVRRVMEEVASVALRLDLKLPVTVEQRMAGAEKVGDHKTSMLQDLQRGRPMELEAVVGAVVELARQIGTPMPCTETIYACTRLVAEIKEER